MEQYIQGQSRDLVDQGYTKLVSMILASATIWIFVLCLLYDGWILSKSIMLLGCCHWYRALGSNYFRSGHLSILLGRSGESVDFIGYSFTYFYEIHKIAL